MKQKDKMSDEMAELQALRESVRRLKEKLGEAESRFKALTETSLQGIVIVQGLPVRVVYASRPVADMLGYSTEEILSASPDQIQNLMYGEDRRAFLSKYENRLEGKAVPPHYEARVTRKDGEVRWLEIFSSRI